MEFRPSATFYGMRLFDGANEAVNLRSLRCKSRHGIAGKQYGMNG